MVISKQLLVELVLLVSVHTVKELRVAEIVDFTATLE